ncbi:hypothetical protein [Roseateles puraquae]|uniref:hypothetical protein n=1 Tax=Roseateles puraquae TaxID=431059 RepID=UPI0031CF230C
MSIRKVKWTVLAVGEGDSEVALLEHLKAIYFSRSCGSTIKIMQAYGKGAGNVVRHAIAYAADHGYDRSAVLFDTDTDYTPEVIQLAQMHRLITLPAEPCLEGWMLRLHGDNRSRTSDQHKTEFARRFGGRVQDADVLATHFGLRSIEQARNSEPVLHRLINTFGIPRRIARSKCMEPSPKQT